MSQNKNNNEEQIKAAFTNFIGLMIDNSKYNNKQAMKHTIVTCLLEEIIPICKDENNNYDLFIIKPILRLTIAILNNRINLLQDYSSSVEVRKMINSYKFIINEFNNILDCIKIEDQ